MKRWYLLCLFAVLMFSARAQQEQVFSSEEAAPVQVVKDIFAGMAEGDSAKVRAGFRENPVFFSVFRTGKGEHVLHSDPTGFEKWLESIGTPHDAAYNEELYDIEVRMDGDLAMVWMKYALFVGQDFHHCGIDLFQLNRDAEGQWKTFQLSDTKRKSDCEVPDWVKPE